MNISVCLTNYNRTTLLYESIVQVLDDERVNEFVISDDCSRIDLFNQVVDHYKDHPKVKVFRNDRTLDCYLNKRCSVERASNEWVILFDSDNILTKEYIDRIENLWIAGINTKTVYQPDFAQPHFNFEKYGSTVVNQSNVKSYLGDATFQTMLNAMNYFVNREQYLKVFDTSVDPVTSDSIFHNYNWLKAGNSIYVVPGLQYYHRVHDDSHYKNNVRRTPRHFHDEVINKLKQLV